MDEAKVDHFLDFISRPEFLQDVAYGTRTMKLSHGEKLEIPNVVRTTIVSRLIQMYLAYCEEIGFQPLKRSSLFSIIQARMPITGIWSSTSKGVRCISKKVPGWIRQHCRRRISSIRYPTQSFGSPWRLWLSTCNNRGLECQDSVCEGLPKDGFQTSCQRSQPVP
ncbi:uncharacterized protein LOC135500898 [Lineus longissimus]|uniref:uncharacterized protein LOC135500898 n=1 Tax=Lineus longissimus TaxID=88925 RepID=UPI00315D6C2F